MINVYACNHASAAHVAFWSKVALNIPSADSWCVGSDSNKIEAVVGDRHGGSLKMVHGAELTRWERACLALRLEDAWCHPYFARS